MKEIVNEYRESLLQSHKSDNTVYAYVTDVNLYIKYLNSKDIYLDETDNVTVKNYIEHLLEDGKSSLQHNGLHGAVLQIHVRTTHTPMTLGMAKCILSQKQVFLGKELGG